MSYIHQVRLTPPSRSDNQPWTLVHIYESAALTGPFTLLTPVTSFPVDATPATADTVLITFSNATLASGYYRFQFEDGAGGLSAFTNTILDPAPTTPIYYATTQDLRNELGTVSDALSDAQLSKLISNAEDLIDVELGVRLVDDATGRRVVQADIDSWRYLKLTKATVLLAAALYNNPNAFGQQYRTVSGPDFSFSGPIGTSWPIAVTAALNASGLRRLTAVASVRAGRRGWRGVLLDDGTWDDEEVWSQ